MNFVEVINLIEKYDKIIVLRHIRPDLDALGSQVGLTEALKFNYPEKTILKTGDFSKRLSFIGQMDEVKDEDFKDSLVIICDVAVAHMVSDERYKLAKEILVIDHHHNDCTVEGAHTIVMHDKVATAELIASMLEATNKGITPEGATALYGGIVTDSGRFQYKPTSANTFRTCAWLLEHGADMEFIYGNLYVETLKQRELKNFFSGNYHMLPEGVAFMKNTKEIMEKFLDVEFFDISRGMVSLMAGIEEIVIWANFTYDKESSKVIGEFRSRGIVIVDIAKKYGGGGHPTACGATLDDFNMADLVIEDFKKLAKEYKEKN